MAEALVAAFGEKGFDYIGNDHADMDVWRFAAGVYVVDAHPSLARKVGRDFPDATVLVPRRPRLRSYVKALRPHQWLKNLLIFVPLLAGHFLGSEPRVLQTLVAFVAFGMTIGRRIPAADPRRL